MSNNHPNSYTYVIYNSNKQYEYKWMHYLNYDEIEILNSVINKYYREFFPLRRYYQYVLISKLRFILSLGIISSSDNCILNNIPIDLFQKISENIEKIFQKIIINNKFKFKTIFFRSNEYKIYDDFFESISIKANYFLSI